MRHQITLKRDAYTPRITVEYSEQGFFNRGSWRVNVAIVPPRKSKFIDVVNSYDYSYRALSVEEKHAMEKELQLEVVTAEEILAAKLELWISIQPKLEDYS